jgi:WD40 repeat protein
VINMWDASTGQLAASLTGHTLTVCGLAVSAIGGGQLVSVSWDKTARIWDLSSLSCSAILTGHEAAVWAVLPLDDGTILTGSADHSIKKWRGTACEITIKGHTDCVRSLAKTEFGFASAGNDAVIKLWTLNGECIMQMTGHTSFIYSIAVLPTGEIVSSSEDKTARIWNGGECISVIQHAGSVWCVAALPNGDVITGCADAVTRIWTRDPSRMADAATLLNYDQMLAQQTISAQASFRMCVRIGNPSDLPAFRYRKLAAFHWISCLASKGLKCLEPRYIDNAFALAMYCPCDLITAHGFMQDGATKIVRVGTSAIAYAWNASESKWDQIGWFGIFSILRTK